ncbi:MAG: transglycosylase SLT domain-containing protein [candidate division Zixibacteria bacterium]|nr:transglycosylase SLT domain-containing protein [candidate division Zixibacteria bacterium]
MKIPSGQELLLPLQTATKSSTATSAVGGKSLDMEKLRLRKATRELESFFVLHMLKAMRQTIPKSNLLSGGLGEDTYTSMFDEELSKLVAGGPASLSESLYKSLEKHLTEESGDTLASSGILKSGVARTTSPSSSDSGGSIVIDKPEVKTAPKNTSSSKTPSAPAVRPKITSDAVLENFGSTIEEASRKYSLDPTLVYSVIITESGGDPNAVSPKGAKGLMQLMDSTAEQLGVADSLNPQQNINGGAKYLRQLLDKYDGDLPRTLAAYNAGPGAVDKHKGVPPYAETKRYVDKVMGHLSRITRR